MITIFYHRIMMIKKLMKTRKTHLIEVPSGNTSILIGQFHPFSKSYVKKSRSHYYPHVCCLDPQRNPIESAWFTESFPLKNIGHVTMDCLPSRTPTSCCIRSIWSQKMSLSRCLVVHSGAVDFLLDVRWRNFGVYRRCLETLDASKYVTLIQDSAFWAAHFRESTHPNPSGIYHQALRNLIRKCHQMHLSYQVSSGKLT